MLYQVSQLYVYPDYSTYIVLLSGKAHINGQFLQSGTAMILQPGFLVQVTVISPSQLYFTPEPPVKFYYPAEDAILRNTSYFLQRLHQSPKVDVFIHISHSQQTMLTHINLLQANNLSPVIVDLSQHVLPASYFLTKQAFQPTVALYNPLVFPAVSRYFKRLVDIGLEIVSADNQALKYAVLVIALAAVEEKFSRLSDFRQYYQQICQILYESAFQCDITAFTDCMFFGQQCDMVFYNYPSFLGAELQQSTQYQILRRYFYGTDEKLTPKSIDVPREKIVFLDVKFDDLKEAQYTDEFKYGLIKGTDGNEIIGLVKIYSVSAETVQMVVCNKDILSQDQIVIIQSKVDIV